MPSQQFLVPLDGPRGGKGRGKGGRGRGRGNGIEGPIRGKGQGFAGTAVVRTNETSEVCGSSSADNASTKQDPKTAKPLQRKRHGKKSKSKQPQSKAPAQVRGVLAVPAATPTFRGIDDELALAIASGNSKALTSCLKQIVATPDKDLLLSSPSRVSSNILETDPTLKGRGPFAPLRLAAAMKNIAALEALIDAGAMDVVHDGSCALVEAARGGFARGVVQITEGAPYAGRDCLPHWAEEGVRIAAVAFLAADLKIPELLAIDLLRILAHVLTRRTETDGMISLRRLLDDIARILGQGATLLPGEQPGVCFHSFAHLLIHRCFPTLLLVALRPLSTSSERLLYLRSSPGAPTTSGPSALQLAERAFVRAKQSRDSAVEKQGSNGPSQSARQTLWGNSGTPAKKSKHVPIRPSQVMGTDSSRDIEALWLCIVTVAESSGVRAAVESSDAVHEVDTRAALLAHFGLERLLVDLRTGDGAESATFGPMLLQHIAEMHRSSQQERQAQGSNRVLPGPRESLWRNLTRPITMQCIPTAPAAQSLFDSDDSYWETVFTVQGSKSRRAELLHVFKGFRAPPPHVVLFDQDDISFGLAENFPSGQVDALQREFTNTRGHHGEDSKSRDGEACSAKIGTMPHLRQNWGGVGPHDPPRVDFWWEAAAAGQGFALTNESVDFLLSALADSMSAPSVFLSWTFILSELCTKDGNSTAGYVSWFECLGRPITWQRLLAFVRRVGLQLLYGATGQCDGNDGCAMEEREKDLFDAAWELIIRLLPPYSNAVALQLSLPATSKSLHHVVTALSQEIADIWAGLRQALAVIEGNVYLMPERFGSLLRGYFIWNALSEDGCRQASPALSALLYSCAKNPVSGLRRRNKRNHVRLSALVTSALRTATLGVSAGRGGESGAGIGLLAVGGGAPAGLPLEWPGLAVPLAVSELLGDEKNQEAVNQLVLTEPGLLREELSFCLRMEGCIGTRQKGAFVYDELERGGGQEVEIFVNRMNSSKVPTLASIIGQLADVSATDLARGELTVRFEDEEGAGEGPLREFLDSTRAVFSPVPAQGLPILFTAAPGDHTGSAVVPRAGPPSLSADLRALEKQLDHLCAMEAQVRSDLDSLRMTAAVASSKRAVSMSHAKPRAPRRQGSDKSKGGKGHGTGKQEAEMLPKSTEVTTSTEWQASLERLEQRLREANESISHAHSRLSYLAMEEHGALVAGRILGLSIKYGVPLGVRLPRALWEELRVPSGTLQGKGSRGGKGSPQGVAPSVPWELYCCDDDEYRAGLTKLIAEAEGAPGSVEELGLRFAVDEASARYGRKRCQVRRVVENLHSHLVSKKKKTKSRWFLNITFACTAVRSYFFLHAHRFVSLATRRRLLRGADDRVAQMRRGLQDVIPHHLLTIFSAAELETLVGGPLLIDVTQWREAVVYQGGMSHRHPVASMFWSVVVEDLSEDERRNLLLFWSASSVAPLFGFDGGADGDSDFHLELLAPRDLIRAQDQWCPEVSTCDRTLRLPEYSNRRALLAALRVALSHGSVGYDRA